MLLKLGGSNFAATIIDGLLEACASADRSTTSRLLSFVSRGSFAEAAQVSRGLVERDLASTTVIGVTGPPGVGKSTLTSALISEFRRGGLRVGVLAVDPSSPVSGGAVLGDRIRMNSHGNDPDVFIRSLSSRGHLGGLVRSAVLAVRVLAASGYDVVIVETVGVGQGEVDVAQIADSVILTLAPGTGDAIQVQKAGVLEIADLFVVNKADIEGARAAVSDLREMLILSRRKAGEWEPKIVQTVAVAGTGLDELVETLALHRTSLIESGELINRRQRRAQYEARMILESVVSEQMAEVERDYGSLADRHVDPDLDPYVLAELDIAALGRRLLGGVSTTDHLDAGSHSSAPWSEAHERGDHVG